VPATGIWPDVAAAPAPGGPAAGAGAAGACAKTGASAKKGSTTLNTKAARDNPDLLFVLMSFSMVWLGLVLGNINIFTGDKLFFHFFEIFLNGLLGTFVASDSSFS
jgi:hypothetical protein